MSRALVYGSTTAAGVTAATLEGVAAARQAIGDGGEVVVFAAGSAGALEPLLGRGADRVLYAEEENLQDYQADLHLQALERAVGAAGAEVVVFPADDAGQELAPRLAHRLEAGMITDVVELSAGDDGLEATRPVFGGKAMAVMTCTTDNEVYTLRLKTTEPLPEGATDGGELEPLDVDIDGAAAGTEVVDRQEPGGDGVQLEDADIVVSGGRGLGGSEGFDDVRELADILGGAVGASLAAVDAGWISPEHQVGQTGHMVSPDLYIAIGISGAIQHMAGIAGAKQIVAINKDEEAPIYDKADFGVVTKYEDVVPHLKEALRELVE